MNRLHQPSNQKPGIRFWLLSCIIMCFVFGETCAYENTWRIVFNQPQYAAGDTALFAMVGLGNKQVSEKTVFTVKLLDKEGTIVFNNRILSTAGLASGYVLFPEGIPAGVLTMVIIPEVRSEDNNFGYTVNWWISENGTILCLNNKQINDTCTKTKISVDSLFGVRDKVTVKVVGERINNLVVASYNKQVFTDFDNGIYVEPDTVTVNSNLNTTARWPYYFRGRVIPEVKEKTRLDSIAITVYLSKSNLIYKVYTNKNGLFEFPLFMDFEDDWVFYKITRKEQTIIATIELEDVTIAPTQVKVDTAKLSLTYSAYNNIRKSVESSYHFFQHKENTAKASPPQADIIADIDVSMEKYEPFNTVYDIFLNVVPMVKYRVGEPDQVRVFLKKSAGYAMTDPLYIVNGYMTDQTELIARLDPKSIKRIGVLRTEKTLARFDKLGSNGIIVIETTIPVALVSKNSFFVRGVTKYPITSTAVALDSKTPDLRPSVFWWAGKLPVEGFSFYTSNAPGQYIIHTFVTGSEKPCSIQQAIRVSISK
ncbi:MAG: hypothetical protein KF856_06235 [Cyclobacteriaceae bacterium]|nr:hypothetical protein [Cyclobacteriaceae bacterium]